METNETEKRKAQVRKTYKRHDSEESEQKMFSFRLDCKLLAWLSSKGNKGRYINDLIRADMKRAWVDPDERPSTLKDLLDNDERRPYDDE